ncbi:tetratricopeptide repeat protein [Sphingorhabdus sp.]|uniref:tetratricopeptide repeat protein n=1 Tax=Sphingorhabdus sp. TaxID=1902408 RepID=UPI003593D8BC
MLLLEPDESLERDHICKLLWTGRFEAQARASLRQCLLGLGKILDPLECDLLEISRSRISLNTASVRSDLDDLEKALADGKWAQATASLLDIGGKQLLDQLNFGEEFEAWLAERRQAIEQKLQTQISDALDKLKTSGNPADQDKLLDAWMARHPASSRAIMADRQSGRTRIAILPFASQDSENIQGYFADGIVDELITALGQVPQMLVAGRTSSFQFKDTELSLPEIADLLHVSHLVEGSVQRDNTDVRMNVRLIDGQTGFESWSYSYDGTEDDIFSSRKQLARKITKELGAALKLDIAEPDIRPMTHNKEAYGLYLQGRALTRRAIGDGVLGTAIKLLEQALELEPEFAECWTALAEAHVYTAVYTPCLDKLGEVQRMAECAQKAIELSPKPGHAYAMLGLYQWTQNDAVGALDLALKAYQLEPENPAVVMRLGSFLLYCGRTAEALPYIEAAIDQDPVDGRNYGMLCVAQLNLGNIDAAIRAGQRMADLGQPSLHLAAATAASGNHELAVEQYKKTRLLMNSVIFPPAGTTPMSPEAMDAYWLLAAKGVHSGREDDRQQYCQMLEMLHASFPDPCDPTIVWPAIWMGYAPMVFKTLGKQITPPNMVGLMSLWADIEPIRQTRIHPDFMDFAKRIGLVAAWEKYGWPDLIPEPCS